MSIEASAALSGKDVVGIASLEPTEIQLILKWMIVDPCLRELPVHHDLIEDAWGNPYRYLKIAGQDLKGKGKGDKARKDHFMVPVNTDYDLYSMGPDGVSKPPFTAQASRDDIVRANDGRYVGPASEY